MKIEFTRDGIDDIRKALQLRLDADVTGNPILYRQAAELFSKNGWIVTAEACLQKAEYYEAQS